MVSKNGLFSILAMNFARFINILLRLMQQENQFTKVISDFKGDV